MPHESAAGGQELAAYWVPETGRELTVAELRRALGERLAEHMIPSLFVRMDKLPLAANGKIDRRALPDPNNARADDRLPYVAPRNVAERKIAQLFAQVLAIDRVGVTEDFFDLGGDSLLAAQLLLGIERALQRKCPLKILLEASTVERLASRLAEGEVATPEVLEIQPNGRRPPFFLVAPYPLHRLLAKGLGDDQPLLGLPLPEELPESLQTESLARVLLQTMKNYQPRGPYTIGGSCALGSIAFEMAQQLTDQGDAVSRVILLDAFCPGTDWRAEAPKRRGKSLREHLRTLPYRWQSFTQLSAKQKFGHFSWRVREILHRGAQAMQRQFWWLGLCEQPEAPHLDIYRRARIQSQHYRVRPYTGRLALFRAEMGLIRLARRSDFGWGEVARGGLDICDVPGDHESMFMKPHVAVLAQKLGHYLMDVSPKVPEGAQGPG